MTIKVGELRHCLVILSKKTVPDEGGGEAVVWSAGASFFAKVEPIIANERFRAMALDARVTHRISCRYRADLDPSKRVKFGNRIFRLVSVLNTEERNIELVMYAEELGVGG